MRLQETQKGIVLQQLREALKSRRRKGCQVLLKCKVGRGCVPPGFGNRVR